MLFEENMVSPEVLYIVGRKNIQVWIPAIYSD